MKRPIIFISAAVVFVVSVIIYFAVRTPPGVEPMGGAGETIAWISLVTAIISLITTIVGLLQKIIELRHTPSRKV
jgi:hypothetical protein